MSEQGRSAKRAAIMPFQMHLEMLEQIYPKLAESGDAVVINTNGYELDTRIDRKSYIFRNSVTILNVPAGLVEGVTIDFENCKDDQQPVVIKIHDGRDEAVPYGKVVSARWGGTHRWELYTHDISQDYDIIKMQKDITSIKDTMTSNAVEGSGDLTTHEQAQGWSATLGYGPHGATILPTPHRIVFRDEHGRIKIADGIADNDAVTKKHIDDRAADLSEQAATAGQVLRNGTAKTFARSDHYHALPAAIKNPNALTIVTGIAGATETTATYDGETARKIPLASADALGLVKLGHGTTIADATVNTGSVNSPTAERTYPVQRSADGRLRVTVPWIDYKHPEYSVINATPSGSDQTPNFGGTFNIAHVSRDATGHINTLTSQTVKIPSLPYIPEGANLSSQPTPAFGQSASNGSANTNTYARSDHSHALPSLPATLTPSNHGLADAVHTGTLNVAKGGTGLSTIASGEALIGAGTGNVNTRAITNNTSIPTASPADSTNLATMNSLKYAWLDADNIKAGTFDAARIPNLSTDKLNSGTLPVARGGTGLSTIASGEALIGAGTGNVNTRAITNNTSIPAASPADSTNLVTMNTLKYAWIDAGNIKAGTLPVARGGTGLTAAPSLLTNLGATAAAEIFAAAPRPGVTGTLPIANGGTGRDTPAFISFGACTIAANTVAKTSAITGFTLTTGCIVGITFTNANTAAAPTLNVNTTGAKNIQCNGANLTASDGRIPANVLLLFQYNRTAWQLLNPNDLTGTLVLPVANGGTGIATSTTANRIFATAESGTTATAPSFRALVAADIPDLNTSKLNAGTLGVARGGTGLTAAPSMLTNLGSTTAAEIFAASPRPGVTGTLPVANGGTGVATVAGTANNRKVFASPKSATAAAPAFIDLDASDIGSGILPVERGGTGATFIIDSDAKLQTWANNTAGNDYSRILIKKGGESGRDHWLLNTSSAIAIDISTGRTKSVIGESGSKIVINNTGSSSVIGI